MPRVFDHTATLRNSSVLAALSACLIATALGACGGTKVLKDPVPIEIARSLAVAADEHIAASLDWIIFPNGPGSWAYASDWDEYMMRIQNLSDDTISITGIIVQDSLGTAVDNRGSMRGLVLGSKQAARRYKDEKFTIHAGAGGSKLILAGGVVGYTSYGLALAAMAFETSLGTSFGMLAPATIGLFVVAPALIVGGVQRNKNYREIAREIGSRQTLLPVLLLQGEGKNLDLFYPITPSPQQIEITYADANGEHSLLIDTREVLAGLHLSEPQ